MFHRSIMTAIGCCLLVSVAGKAEEVCLKYDDGTQESKRSMTGGGHAVLFECPDDEQWYVTAVAIHGARYGSPRAPKERFSVVVASEDFQQVAKTQKPYSLFKRGAEQWVKFDLRPIEVPKKFQVLALFNPTRTKGVYVGIDQDSSPTHSLTVVPDEPEETKSNIEGDWMIQAFITKNPAKKPRALESLADHAKALAKQEADTDAKLLGDARSLTLKHDEGEMDEYMNIRGALYTVEFETPKDVEAYVWQVQLFASQFGREHDSEAVNGDVYILDANRNIISRTSFPYSLATQQKEWLKISTLPTRVKGKFFVSVDTHGTSKKGLYMGYQNAQEPDNASADEIKEDSVGPGEWSSKFDEKRWMIRAKVADRPVVYR